MMLRIGVSLFTTLIVLAAPLAARADAQHPCMTLGPSNGYLMGLVQQFGENASGWMSTALVYAQHLFLGLVAIEIAWSGITYVLQKDSLGDFIAALLLKLLAVGFFWMLVQPSLGPTWIAAIIGSFAQAGSAISGQPAFGPRDPSTVFSCGTDIANVMLQSISQNNTHLNLSNLLSAGEAILAALISAFGVIIAYAIVAGQLLVTLIEAYLCISAGIFMLGFTGSRWTLVFGERYIGYVISIGIKLFMLEFIIGVGYTLGQEWSSLFGDGLAPPETYLEVVGAALIFGMLAWQLPSLAASLMNGTPRLTLGTALSTAGAGMVSGAVGATGARSAVGAMNEAAQRGLTRLSEATGIPFVRPWEKAASALGAESNGASAGATSARAPNASPSSASAPPGASASTTSNAATAGSNSSDATAQPSPADPSGAQMTGQTASEGDSNATSAAKAPSATARPSASGHGGTRPPAIGAPAIPSDGAEGSVHIRFNHPE